MTTRSFTIRNEKINQAPRQIKVDASEAELTSLINDGYIVRNSLIPPDMLERLRTVVDEIENERLKTAAPNQGGGFGGLFVRNILAHHPIFLELARWNPLVSVARAVLGPQVQVHGSVLRVAYPGLQNQGVEWHFHQRVVPDPAPPFFFRPVVLDNLIYLDDLTADSGPLVVLPKTHWEDRDLPAGDHTEKQGQKTVLCSAGSVVTSHSGLWHKAISPSPNAPRRRLVILGYSPVWMKQIDLPASELVESLRNADEETRELLGWSGYF